MNGSAGSSALPRRWAAAAVVGGLILLLGLEWRDEANRNWSSMAIALVDVLPVVAVSVGVMFLIQVTRRQRDENLALLRDLEVARLQGQRWRAEARTVLSGLGEAIEAQFSRWNLTEAEREVALLLLKGLSLKEAAAVRATTERTIRAHARSLYAKAGLTGRAALAAFFLEDLLAPIGDPGRSSLP
ncbi:MAG TPA: LuxR C-terminal-related transcriptional regulator [Vicinamibacterales bacterium]|jgi:DNA-binding CsgD family transcriptional regulator